MFTALANPHRFMAFSGRAAPVLGVGAALFIAAGLWLGFTAPPDYQQGTTVRIMFVHVPAAWTAMVAYACLGGASFFSLVFRHALADAAARAAAPLGAAFTLMALITGSLWGRPMWGAWWVWDARLTSVLVLFLLFVGYIALRSAIDDEAKSARAAAILSLVGLVNLPIVKFSVDWWNSLHQGESIFRAGGPTIAAVFLIPLGLMGVGYLLAFGALWMERTRAEVWRRRSQVLAMRAASSIGADKYAVFVWPAYGVSALGFAWMVFDTVSRARGWRRKTQALEGARPTGPGARAEKDAAP